MPTAVERPASEEYNAFYGGYINRVPEGDIFDVLSRQPGELNQLVGHLSDAQALYRFEPNQWSIKAVLGHINDTERIFAYRALCVSRGESAPLPGFEQDEYVRTANFDARPLAELLQEFDLMRRSNVLLFKDLSMEASLRRGTVSGWPITARAMIYILPGHAYHHMESLRTDYGVH